MDVAIVAPCPVPYARGGAENLWRSLQDHLNDATAHRAEILKLPSREHGLWDLVESYRAFSALDLTGFDVVLSGKYPAWMVDHPRHMVYLLHRLRGLYDTYHYFGLPDAVDAGLRTAADGLVEFMEEHAGRREALPEFFERAGALRRREASLPPELLAFPGPFVRAVVHWLDAIGMAPTAIRRYGAIAATVRDRPGYFPDGSDVFVVHPPSELPVPAKIRGEERRRPYLFTVSRLDGAKRIDLLIQALATIDDPGLRLRIAGTGPEEERLRELAASDPRIAFCGRVSEEDLQGLYGGARAVAFVPHDEDFGYVTLEAMAFGRPVVTVSDAGGPGELVQDCVTGVVADPTPEALGAALLRVWTDRRARAAMGAEGRRRAQTITWEPLVLELEALA